VQLSSRKNRSNRGKTVQALYCSIRYGEYNGLWPTMNRFIHEQNIKHLREVLARTTDEAKRRLIVELIEAEEEDTRQPGGNRRRANN
jgi:hypothetical protein